MATTGRAAPPFSSVGPFACDEHPQGTAPFLEPFGCVDKPAEKYYWLICYERKIRFRLKNQLKKTDYKPNEQNLCSLPWCA
jgi:hypothetical protein